MFNRDALLAQDDETLLKQCRQQTYRASGPGGQHRNKTDSAVRLSLMEGSVAAQCSDHRSQHRNRAESLKRLRVTLALEVREPFAPEKNTEWKGGWKLGKKDRRYPVFLAHLLDVMAHNSWAVGLTASNLGTSTGKLIRTLARDPQAWNAVNQARTALGLVNLRRP